ncbi:MAG: hypothetical protein WC360_03825 [Opitutales bacterium]|jgi:hypothetical protein
MELSNEFAGYAGLFLLLTLFVLLAISINRGRKGKRILMALAEEFGLAYQPRHPGRSGPFNPWICLEGRIGERNIRILKGQEQSLFGKVPVLEIDLRLREQNGLTIRINANNLAGRSTRIKGLKSFKTANPALDKLTVVRSNKPDIAHAMLAMPELADGIASVFARHKIKGFIEITQNYLHYEESSRALYTEKHRQRICDTTRLCVRLANAADIVSELADAPAKS